MHQSCSKRAFDGQVRKWRRMLHAWDPPGAEGDADADAAATTLASPGGTKRSASTRTPATAGRRKQGRTEGGKEEGVPAAPAFDEGDWVDAAAEVGP